MHESSAQIHTYRTLMLSERLIEYQNPSIRLFRTIPAWRHASAFDLESGLTATLTTLAAHSTDSSLLRLCVRRSNRHVQIHNSLAGLSMTASRAGI